MDGSRAVSATIRLRLALEVLVLLLIALYFGWTVQILWR